MTVPPPGAWPSPAHAGPAPLDQPQYDATLGQAVARFWRKFAVFSGRASRSEYWWWVLASFGVSVVLQVVGRLTLGGGLVQTAGAPLDLRSVLVPLVPSLVWSVVTLVPTFALAVRRLHDTDRSGWWCLLTLPTVPGLVFELMALASFDAQQVAVGDFSSIAVGPLVAAVALLLLGTIGGIILVVFFILGPDPRGRRFDRSA